MAVSLRLVCNRSFVTNPNPPSGQPQPAQWATPTRPVGNPNRHRVQCPGQRLTMLLSAMLPGSELESFANRTFTVQFGKDGELTVSAA